MYSSQSFRTTPSPLNEEASLGILKHLNKDELNDLLNNDHKLEQLIQDDDQVRHIQITKNNLITTNRSLAEYNLSQEPRLASAKQHLTKSYEEGIKAQKEYDEKKEKIAYTSSRYSLDIIGALLQTEAAKSDEQSENIAEEFLEGGMEAESFIERYIPQRTIAHQHKTKSEKTIELIRSGAPVAPPGGGYGQNPAPYPSGGPSTWTRAPYPAQNMAMPNVANYLPR